jgi:hypothetical protein
MQTLTMTLLSIVLLATAASSADTPCPQPDELWGNWKLLPDWVQQDWRSLACSQEAQVLSYGKILYHGGHQAVWILTLLPPQKGDPAFLHRVIYVAFELRPNTAIDGKTLYEYREGRMAYGRTVWDHVWTYGFTAGSGA